MVLFHKERPKSKHVHKHSYTFQEENYGSVISLKAKNSKAVQCDASLCIRDSNWLPFFYSFNSWLLLLTMVLSRDKQEKTDDTLSRKFLWLLVYIQKMCCILVFLKFTFILLLFVYRHTSWIIYSLWPIFFFTILCFVCLFIRIMFATMRFSVVHNNCTKNNK